MTVSILLYFISLLLTILLTGGLTWFAWRQPKLPGVRPFAWLAAGDGLLALMELLLMLAGSPAQAIFWFKMRFLFLATIPVLWLTFALDYSGHRDWLARRLLAGSLVVPILTQIVLWSKPLHGLWLSHDVDFVKSGPFWVALTNVRVPGPWFMFYSIYSLLLLVAGIGVIFLVAWQRRKNAAQAGLFVAGAMIALAVSLISTYNLFPQLRFSLVTPALGLSILLYAIAIFRFQFLKQPPTDMDVARITALGLAEKRFVAVLMLIFFVAVSGIVATGYVIYRNFQQDFVTQVEEQLSATTSLKVDGLSHWRQERLADAGLFYHNDQFAEQMRLFLDDPQDPAQRARLLAWMQKLEAVDEYHRIFLLDPQGAVLLSFPQDSQPTPSDLVDHAGDSLASDQVIFLDLHRHAGDSSVFLSTMTPIFDDQLLGQPLGVLVLQIDPTVYLYPFLQQWPVPSQSAETLLIRRQDDTALFLNPLRFQSEAALSLSVPISQTQLTAVKAALGQTGIVTGSDYRGVEVVADIRPVLDSPWFLVSKMDRSDIYAPLGVRLWQTVLFFGLLILVAGVSLFQLWRRQQTLTYRARYADSVARRVSEEKFRIAFDTSPDAIAINRLVDGMYVSINRSFTHILGYNESDIVGKSSLELEIWDDPQDRQGLVQELLATGVVNNLEARFRTKSGSIKIGLMSASVIALDGVRHILSITRDVTERRHSELAIQKIVVARLDLVEFAQTHSIHDLLVRTLDDVCAIVESPIGFYHFVQADQQTLSLQAWSTRTMQDYCRAAGEGLHYGLEEAGVWADCVRDRRPLIHNDYASMPNRRGLPTGHAELVRELVVPILRNDQIVAILGVGNKAQDYTQEDVDQVVYFADVAWEIVVRKRAEEMLSSYAVHLEREVEERTRELRATQEQLLRRERLATLGQLAGSIGHELRNPLGVISNAVYFLKMAQPQAEDGLLREYLDIIENEIHISNKIVTDLLDFTRIKSVDRRSVALTDLIHQTLVRFPPPPSLSVALKISPDLPRIFADPQHVIQILGNLTVNACQAMPDGGLLTLTATPQADMMAISVQDTGAGIPSENMDRLFEPLFTTKINGVGLGLAVSKKFAEANDGRIEVQSQPGVGSIFTLLLPLSE